MIQKAVMKELIGKVKLKSPNLPRQITVNKVDLFDETKNSARVQFFPYKCTEMLLPFSNTL